MGKAMERAVEKVIEKAMEREMEKAMGKTMKGWKRQPLSQCSGKAQCGAA